MKNPIQTTYRYGAQITVLGALLAIPTGLMAITIDGNVQGLAEGYQNEYNVSFNVQGYGSNPVTGGKLYTAQNGNVLSFGLILPFAIDDNLYGTGTDYGTPGWGTHTHTFNELLGSDQWQMSIKTVGGATININLDYLYQNGSTYVASATQGDAKGGTTPAYGAAITVASSEQYNLTLGVANATVNSPANGANPNWINEIEYEWQIDFTGFAAADKFTIQDVLNTFTGNVDSKNSPDYLHVSPNKLGQNVTAPNPPTPVTVPDGGSTATLFGLALLGMGGLSRKLRKA